MTSARWGTGSGASALAALIRTRRSAAGMSQQQLAERAGVSVGTLRDLEQGRTCQPRARLLAGLADALDLDVAQVTQAAAAGAGDAGTAPATEGQREGLWLRLLGPLAAWRDGTPLPLGQPQQRAVLALLALNAGVGVGCAELVDAVWGEDPPASAVNLVQAYVGRLRQVLDPGRAPRDPAGVLVSTGRCYLLRLGVDELDWLRFRDLLRRARAAEAAGALRTSCELYGEALELWHGDPLAEVQVLRGGAAVALIHRTWAAAVSDYAHTAVSAGAAARVLPDLWRLTGDDPLNEKARAQLMLALAACGQQAAALRVFEEIRGLLDTQLGIRPGTELSEAYVRILRQQVPGAGTDGDSDGDGAGVEADARPEALARQLPPAAPGFVGHVDEMKALTTLVDDVTETRDTPVIAVIGGVAGIGKTALAVHWAHSVADRFPDGQLYVDLRGFDPAVPPLATAEVIRCLLDAMRVSPAQMPAGVEAQGALYRRLLAGRRVLVLLDNARDSAQVRPLLPDSPTCLVLVTSRQQLTSLAAAEGAHQLNMDLLNDADARALLTGRLGAERVAAEAAAVDRLITLCAGLPLALCIAAARAAVHPDFPMAALATTLSDARHRLDTLSGGDATSDLRTLFRASYQHLSPAAALMFRLLGRQAGAHVALPAAASLAGLGRREAHLALAELADAHLLTEYSPGRYHLHDLLRIYASELSGHQDSEAVRCAAADRTLAHYLLSLDGVDRLRYPDADPILSPPPLPGVTPEKFTDPDEALAWCQEERPILVAMIGQAARAGPVRYASGKHWNLWLYFHLWSHGHDLTEAREVAMTAVRSTGTNHHRQDPQEAWVPRADDARYRYRQLVQFAARRLDEPAVSAYCLLALTQMLQRQGRHEQGLAYAQHALDRFRCVGDQTGAALALTMIGRSHLQLL